MFSVFEKDKKTFELVQEYIVYLKQRGNDCINIDNKIEMDEIKKWLQLISTDPHDNRAIAAWIKDNGKSFRDYLNTVKLIYLIWFCSRGQTDTISWEDFCAIGEKLNNMENSFLDSIY